MKLTESIARANSEITMADYIDNTARMLEEKGYWRQQLARLEARQRDREPEIEGLVG